ncbi:putative DNA-binding protein [Bacillus paranthracis]
MHVKGNHLTKDDPTCSKKTTRMNYLFDFYQSLLTQKQRSYMSLYYLDDLSLGEIAEEFDVSRQAVYDNIKRTEAMLEEYEEKLVLLQKFQERQRLVAKLKQLISEEEHVNEEMKQVVEAIEKLD